MKIISGDCNFEREQFRSKFSFKGGSITEGWQVVVRLRDREGNTATGLGMQSVLWSDKDVFLFMKEAGGNALMFQLTAYAVQQAQGLTWDRPEELLEQLLPIMLNYTRNINNGHLRLTFILNALVGLDNAAWQLYARERGVCNFDEVVGSGYQAALPVRHDRLAAVPLITYGSSVDDIRALAAAGCPLLKIKIGADPEANGDRNKMLEWDKQRMTEIHRVVEEYRTPHTVNGRVKYYLDANGRYDSLARIENFLDEAAKIGALADIAILEEPFPEECDLDVGNLPVPVAADESAHSEKHAIERMEQGYRVVALKPIAKTMSMSLKIAAAAAARKVKCFCADLTVNPIMVEWNKNVAARLAPIDGMKVGIVETNGSQYYANWEQMRHYHPCAKKPWCIPQDGFFVLDDEFYTTAGGIFIEPEHYKAIVDV